MRNTTPRPQSATRRPPPRPASRASGCAKPEAKDVTGRVFQVAGGMIRVAEGWHGGPAANQDDRWDPAELGKIVPDLVARARANANMMGD